MKDKDVHEYETAIFDQTKKLIIRTNKTNYFMWYKLSLRGIYMVLNK